MKIAVSCLTVLASLALAIASFAADEPPVTLTIYNDNFAMVQEVRGLRLARGTQEYRVSDVTDQIEPTSVRFLSLTDPDTVTAGTYPIARPLFMFTNGYPKLGSHIHRFTCNGINYRQLLAFGDHDDLVVYLHWYGSFIIVRCRSCFLAVHQGGHDRNEESQGGSGHTRS